MVYDHLIRIPSHTQDANMRRSSHGHQTQPMEMTRHCPQRHMPLGSLHFCSGVIQSFETMCFE